MCSGWLVTYLWTNKIRSSKILHRKIKKKWIQVSHVQSNDCGWGVYFEKAQIDTSWEPKDYPRFQLNLWINLQNSIQIAQYRFKIWISVVELPFSHQIEGWFLNKNWRIWINLPNSIQIAQYRFRNRISLVELPGSNYGSRSLFWTSESDL